MTTDPCEGRDHVAQLHAFRIETIELDCTNCYPGEGPPRVPDLGRMEIRSECSFTMRRVTRGGKAGKCEICKNERKRDTETMKRSVCS